MNLTLNKTLFTLLILTGLCIAPTKAAALSTQIYFQANGLDQSHGYTHDFFDSKDLHCITDAVSNAYLGGNTNIMYFTQEFVSGTPGSKYNAVMGVDFLTNSGIIGSASKVYRIWITCTDTNGWWPASSGLQFNESEGFCYKTQPTVEFLERYDENQQFKYKTLGSVSISQCLIDQ